MNTVKIFDILIAGVAAIILTVITSFIRSPLQTYPNGIVGFAQNRDKEICNFPSPPGVSCSDVHSVDYGIPLHVKRINDGVYYPDTMPGTYFNLSGLAYNLLLYFLIALLFVVLLRPSAERISHPMQENS